MGAELQGLRPSLTSSLSPSLSPSPHPLTETVSLTRVSGGALLTVSTRSPRRPATYPHETHGVGDREQHFLCTLILPPIPPCSLLGFAVPSRGCHQLLDCREGCFGHHLFWFLNRSWEGREECSICSLTCHPRVAGPVLCCTQGTRDWRSIVFDFASWELCGS